MTYRSLLVHLGPDLSCASRTHAAIQLAQRLGAHLVGLAPTGLVDLPAVPEAASALGDLATMAWDSLRDQARASTDTFREACRSAGLKSFETVIDETGKASSIVHHAHCCDLTVLSQADRAAAGQRASQEMVEQVLLYSARPTLLIPVAGPVDTVGTRALVAWDDSREAARAVSDALPLLRLSKQVQVVCWKEKGDDGKNLPARLDALHQWLMWQGVAAEVRTESAQAGVAQAMLSCAASMNADLIVMGAYGHARWAERMMGGATQTLLSAMTVPVLMSH